MLGTGVVVKVALSVAMASGASVGAAAYAGALPWGAQHAAGHRHAQHANAHSQHKREHGHGHGAPVGPDATGPAAHGLCTAYSHQHARGKAMGHSIAMRNLARAAGGADRITGYCARVR